MKLRGLSASGSALHKVDRLCRDLNSLSMTAQSTEPVSRKSRRREALPNVASQKRRRFSSCIAQASSAVAAQFEEEDVDVDELKAQLLDSLYGLERGLQASGEVRAEISELISKLEANNPTPAPNQEILLLNGTWTLAYTSNSELGPLLALGRLPGVRVGDIQQIISNLRVVNKVHLSGPFLETSFSTTATVDVTSDKRLQISFQEGCIATPRLLQNIEFPDSISVLGQYVDLTNLKNALHPVNKSVQDAADQISDLVERAPDLKFQINGRASSWLLTTFLDDDMRISRGDGGSVFVLVKS